MEGKTEYSERELDEKEKLLAALATHTEERSHIIGQLLEKGDLQYAYKEADRLRQVEMQLLKEVESKE